MQILIEDLANEDVGTLRALATFLTEYITRYDSPVDAHEVSPAERAAAAEFFGTTVTVPIVPQGTPLAKAGQIVADAGLVPVDMDTGNVLPFKVPTPPPASTATAPATSTVSPVSAPAPAVPLAVLSAPAAPLPPAQTATLDEFDSSGLAWDARIHQENRNKKKDGTWMLKRRIEAALVEEVTKELIARKKFNVASGIPTPAPSAPASVGVTSAAPPFVPPAPATGIPSDDIDVEIPADPNSVFAAVPAPAAPPAPPAAPVNKLREFIMKCSKLTTSGQLTSEQINAAVQQVGAPSMQALGSMQHLIDAANSVIDGMLA